MSFKLLTVSPPEAKAIILCGQAAFEHDLLQTTTFPSHLLPLDNQNAHVDWRTERLKRRIKGVNKYWI